MAVTFTTSYASNLSIDLDETSQVIQHKRTTETKQNVLAIFGVSTSAQEKLLSQREYEETEEILENSGELITENSWDNSYPVHL